MTHLLYVGYVELILMLAVEKRMTSTDILLLQKHKECVDALEKQTKITDWGASSATSDFDQKVTK